MPPPWTTCVTFVQPPVLTRSQGRLCQVIQQENIESLIRDLGSNYKVALIFASPRVTASGSAPFGESSTTPVSSYSSGYLGLKTCGIPLFVGATPLYRTAVFKRTTDSLRRIDVSRPSLFLPPAPASRRSGLLSYRSPKHPYSSQSNYGFGVLGCGLSVTTTQPQSVSSGGLALGCGPRGFHFIYCSSL